MAGGLGPAAVTPGTKDHEDAVGRIGRLIVRFEGGVFGLRSPEVFLIPPAADFESGDGDGGEVVLDGAGAPEVVVGGVVEESLPGGEEFGSGFVLWGFSGGVEGAAGHCIGSFDGGGEGAVFEQSGVLVRIAERGFFVRLHAEDVIVAVGLAEGAVVEEVVAEPDIGHGGLGGDGADGGMGIDAGLSGEEARVGNPDHADAAVVAGDVFEEPGDGVVSVGGLVDGARVVVIGEGAHHDKCALGFVTATDTFINEDVAAAGELGMGGDHIGRAVPLDSVGAAIAGGRGGVRRYPWGGRRWRGV